MTMTKPTKFTFSNVFDIRDSVGKRGIAAAKARPRNYDEDALAAALAQGRAEGAQEAYAEIEARIATAFESVAGQASMLLERQAQMTDRMKHEAAILGHAIAKHLAPALIGATPLAEFEALVEQCFAEMHDEPRVVVKVSPALVEPMKDKVAELAERLNPAGEVVVAGDPSLTDLDCRVEWSDGGIERDYARLESLISEAVQRYVSQPAGDALAPVGSEVDTEPWAAE
jgi:flagellar assembly protein FliH